MKANLKKESKQDNLHALAEAMLTAQFELDAGENATYGTFKAYLIAALPTLGDQAAYAAMREDIKGVFTKCPDAGTWRIATLSTARLIVYGRAATNLKGAVPAQGREPVLKALTDCGSCRDLIKALRALKTVKHGLAGKAKPVKGSKAEGNAIPEEVQAAPTTRKVAIQNACKMLAFITAEFLLPGNDASLIGEVEHVIGQLRKAA
jgi:hypothetical protein